MNDAQMLYEMCHDVLTASEIKAICKSRGLSDKDANSRSLFENVFLSPRGVESAMAGLTAAEAAALHLLRLEDRVVDVTFFDRLYRGTEADVWSYGTFTQRFKRIYDALQRNMVRKGVLIVAAARTTSPTKAKMELWRYRFPPAFASCLPPLFHPATFHGEAGAAQADRLRASLRRLAHDAPADPRSADPIKLDAAGLTLGTRPLSVRAVREWRQSAWEVEIIKASYEGKALGLGFQREVMYRGFLLPETEYRAASPLPALLYAFSRLARDEWATPDDLATLLDVVYAGARHPAPAAICRAGWDSGCLVRFDSGGKEYYRAAELGPLPADDAPERYLPTAGGSVFVDMETIPYAALDHLNQVATLAIHDGRVRVTPNIASMAASIDGLRDLPLMRYLGTHSADFQAALKKFDAQWGKLIVHENLLVARVSDLSLRVKLQQAFPHSDGAAAAPLVTLSDEYIAFPHALLGDIEKVMKKAGHVIKTVRAT